MATLTYDLAIIGRAAIERELASLEKRFALHAQRVNKATGVGPSAAGTGGAGRTREPMYGPGRREQMAALKQREKAEIASAKLVQRTKLNQERELNRARESLDRQRARGLFQQHKEAARERERLVAGRSEFIRSTVGAGTGRVVRGLSAVGTAGASMLGLGGAALTASAVNSAIGLDERTRRLSILGRAPGEQGVDPQSMRKQFVQTGLATGFSAEDVASGVEVYTAKTGDLKGALQNQRVFTTAAQAHGAKASEIFEAAADLSSKLDITGIKGMQEAFAILGQQGKKGSFELKAMAKEFPEILSNAANIGVRGIEGVRDVGAMAQIARQASGSDSEASTALNNFFRKYADEAKNLQAGKFTGGKKVQVFENWDPKQKMLNFTDIFRDFMQKSEGDLTAFQKVFDIRGSKAGNPLANAYREARDATIKGGGNKEDANKAGIAAVDELFGKFRNVNGDWGEVERDAADAMKSTAVQLEILNTQFKEVIGSKLLPELNKLIPVLAQLIPNFAALVTSVIKMVQWFAGNPFKAVVAALAVSIGYEVTKAKISSLIKTGIKAISGGGSDGSGPGGGLPGAPGGGGKLFTGLGTNSANGASVAGTLGAIGTGLSAGLTVGTLIASVGIAKFENSQEEMKDSGQILNRIRNAGVNDLPMVQELLQTLRTREKDARAGSWSDFITGDEDRNQIINTAASMRNEAEARADALKLEAAKAQLEAAKATQEAANGMKAVALSFGDKPNNGDKPSFP